MRPADVFLYLIGNRGAIERIAASKGAVAIGALLVLTAGIARNYDHLDLLRQPEWFLAPLIVSFLSAAIVYWALDFRLALGWGARPQRSQFVPFLALFWMTAPCAWLYAIPVESFTDLLTATKFNVAVLAVVSLWRVALITRAVQVLTSGKTWAVLLAVVVPASAEACLGSIYGGFSLVGIMGGVRLPPHHEFLQAASGVVITGSFWLGIILAPFFLFIPRRLTRSPRGLGAPSDKAGRPIWLTTLVILAIWIAAAVPLQPRMQRRHHLKSLLDQDRIEDAIDYAIEHGPDGFTSWHYLPPDPFARGFRYAPLFEAMDGTEPEWLRTTWLEQSIESLKLYTASSPGYLKAKLESYKSLPGGLEFLLSREQELRESITTRSDPRTACDAEHDLAELDEAFANVRATSPPD